MRLLVVGYAEYDSGKTSLTLQLIRKLRAGGRRVIAAKPVAGHSAWYQYETVVHSAELGLLVGEDAYRIAVELGMLSRVAVLNPVDLLISPLDPFKARGRVEEPLN
ncbi:MAG: ATPase, partial [Thermoprotei archaeon]